MMSDELSDRLRREIEHALVDADVDRWPAGAGWAQRAVRLAPRVFPLLSQAPTPGTGVQQAEGWVLVVFPADDLRRRRAVRPAGEPLGLMLTLHGHIGARVEAHPDWCWCRVVVYLLDPTGGMLDAYAVGYGEDGDVLGTVTLAGLREPPGTTG